MKDEILRQLKAARDFISGQELCRQFAVSRTAVWKVIRQLQEEGYEIEAVRNRGYRLLSSRDILSETELKNFITGEVFGACLIYCKEVDSTNNLAKRLAEDGAPHGALAVAESQQNGKGRRGRSWISPPGTGIWMSIVMRPDFIPAKASALTLVAALAVQRAIAEMLEVESFIKWPNDIVVDGRKICGILTEMNSDMDGIHYIITGIGINVNQDSFPEELEKTATSLKIQTRREVRRAKLIGEVLKWMEVYYNIFIRTEDMSLLIREYNQVMVNRGREVTVLEPKGRWTGIAQGINQEGELLVETAGGAVRTVGSGEVSVRGIYGYV